ncbi:MAG: Hsp20/alpha crystallin family protein [Verrucomicrobiota bacterium]|nr:Hsp20/alpha crystallin family protein [Verrucomicrobiota bacterium]
MSKERCFPINPWKPFSSLLNNDEFWDIAPAAHSGMSVWEDQSNVYIEADLPGLRAKDIDITFDKGTLWICGERKEEEENANAKFYQKSERSYSYRVTVPGDVDINAEPEASYRDGVMKIAFHKSRGPTGKKIQIKS